jgi:hypothetical protein
VDLLLLGFPVLNFASREAILNPKREEKNLTQRRQDAKVGTKSRIAAATIHDFCLNLGVLAPLREIQVFLQGAWCQEDQ